jgi:hypothetical protein
MDMSKEEFDAEYKGQYDYDQIQKEYGDEAIDEGGEKCPQCGMVDCPCEPGECDCDPVEEQSEVIEDIVDEAVENTIDVAINELKQLAGI